MGSHLRFFLDLLCAKAFFGPFLCGGTYPKKPWQCGGRCQTYGFPFDLASWASSVEGFFWTLFVCEGFFWTLFVWWDVPKKTLAVWGQVFRFLVRFFSDLSGIVPCQTYEFPFGLMGLQCRRFFLDPFCM